MNQSVSTYNSTLIGEGEGEGERIYGQQYLHIWLLSKTVCVPISFETDCRSKFFLINEFYKKNGSTDFF